MGKPTLGGTLPKINKSRKKDSGDHVSKKASKKQARAPLTEHDQAMMDRVALQVEEQNRVKIEPDEPENNSNITVVSPQQKQRWQQEQQQQSIQVQTPQTQPYPSPPSSAQPASPSNTSLLLQILASDTSSRKIFDTAAEDLAKGGTLAGLSDPEIDVWVRNGLQSNIIPDEQWNKIIGAVTRAQHCETIYSLGKKVKDADEVAGLTAALLNSVPFDLSNAAGKLFRDAIAELKREGASYDDSQRARPVYHSSPGKSAVGRRQSQNQYYRGKSVPYHGGNQNGRR